MLSSPLSSSLSRRCFLWTAASSRVVTRKNGGVRGIRRFLLTSSSSTGSLSTTTLLFFQSPIRIQHFPFSSSSCVVTCRRTIPSTTTSSVTTRSFGTKSRQKQQQRRQKPSTSAEGKSVKPGNGRQEGVGGRQKPMTALDFFQQQQQQQDEQGNVDDDDDDEEEEELDLEDFQQELQLALRKVNELMMISIPENLQDSETKEMFASVCPNLYEFLVGVNTSTQIRPSTIPNAGRGLFASRNINRGEILTLYPVHMLGLEFQDEDIFRVCSSQEDQDYFETTQHRHKQNNNLSLEYYQYQDRGKSIRSRMVDAEDDDENANATPPTIHLNVNPNQAILEGWKSFLINDGAKPMGYKDEANILQYYKETNERRNCFHIPFGPAPFMATVATREIAKGEELFTSYDFLYWVIELYGLQQQQQEEEGDDGTMMITEAIGQQADQLDATLQQTIAQNMMSNNQQYDKVLHEMECFLDQVIAMDSDEEEE